MTRYTWTAKDPSGNRVVKEVEAGTAAEAECILQAAGYTDLELKEDEVGAAAIAGFTDRPTIFGEEVKTTAADRLKYRDHSPKNFLSAVLNGINESKGFCLLIVAFTAYQAYRQHWVSVALLIVGLIAWLAFLVCVSTTSVYYNKLIQASDWCRWDEVLSLIETLKRVGKFSLVKVPATELTRNRAKALAGQGHLQEALIEYRQCEGRPDCPTWLYKLFVASLYVIAKQHDKAIEYNLASIAEKSTPTAWIDLANRYARYKRDPVKAREAMAEADKSPIPDVAKPFRTRCLGIIAYLEGDLDAAKRDLETAIDLVEQAKSRPFRDGHLSVGRAYLACVLAKQGDLPSAKKCFEQAKAYLLATDEDQLLAECRTVLKLT